MKIKLGMHINISGGIDQSLYDANKAGANAAQIFTKSNRQYLGKLPEPEKIKAFHKAQKELDFYDVFVHAGYLINLAGTGDVLDQSCRSLMQEIEICALYGLKYLVLHPGSANKKDANLACKEAGKNLGEILHMARENFGTRCPEILLETMAGQGSVIGHRFEQLVTIRNAAGGNNIGFCLDTAHLWAAGWNLREREAVREMSHAIEKTLTWDLVKLIHLNDSKEDFDARKDRHQNWPEGKIGFNGLENFLSVIPRSIPLILETPIDKGLSRQAEEIKLIRNIIAQT